MSKLRDFTDRVNKEGSPKLKDWLRIAEKYIEELNSIMSVFR